MTFYILHIAVRESAIYMDLGTRATRTRVAHLPKVVFITMKADMFGLDIRVIFPDVKSLLIAIVHGGIKQGFIQLPALGKEFPSPDDGIVFIIISKAPIT